MWTGCILIDNGSALKMASQLLLENTVAISVGWNIIYTQYRTKEALHDIHSSSIYVLWMNRMYKGEMRVQCQCQLPLRPCPLIHWSSHLYSKVLQIPLPRCWRHSIECQGPQTQEWELQDDGTWKCFVWDIKSVDQRRQQWSIVRQYTHLTPSTKWKKCLNSKTIIEHWVIFVWR